MEMSMGSHTHYISTEKENELVNGTIKILRDAKARKKGIAQQGIGDLDSSKTHDRSSSVAGSGGLMMRRRQAVSERILIL
jgi:hypothetical protein